MVVATEITRFLGQGIQSSEVASFAWVAGLIEGEGRITTQRGYPVVDGFVEGLSGAFYLQEEFWEPDAERPGDLKTPGQGAVPRRTPV